MARLHHTGIVVPHDTDFDDTVEWWAEVLEADLVRREAWTTAHPLAMGLGDHADEVAIQGALLRPRAGGANATCLELHQFRLPGDGAPVTRRTHDQGLGHFAVHVPRAALQSEADRLERLGIDWYAPLQEITSGALAGVLWRYGRVPDSRGGVNFEMTWWPASDDQRP
jgi:catechol 2,3-dioxygenase-like lactoylglutathione lyase family enzyme